MVHADHARLSQATVALVSAASVAAAALPPAQTSSPAAGSPPARRFVALAVSLFPSARAAPRSDRPSRARGVRRGFVQVEVRHSGRGFSETEMSSGDPFAPFAELAGGDDRLTSGTRGLRLALAKGVAESMGGEAGLLSDGPASGAHVWVRIPVWLVRRTAGAEAELLSHQSARNDTWLASHPASGLSLGSGGIGRASSMSKPALRPFKVSGVDAKASLAGRWIMVADDDAVVLRVTCSVLQRWGARAVGYGSGAALVAAVRSEAAVISAMETAPPAAAGVGGQAGALLPSQQAATGASGYGLPDAIIVDSRMPGLSGAETIAAVLAAGRAAVPGWRPRVLMMTGDATHAVEEEAVRAGASGVLSKPVAGAELLASLLGRRSE